jgi:hypothetical protein
MTLTETTTVFETLYRMTFLRREADLGARARDAGPVAAATGVLLLTWFASPRIELRVRLSRAETEHGTLDRSRTRCVCKLESRYDVASTYQCLEGRSFSMVGLCEDIGPRLLLRRGPPRHTRHSGWQIVSM